MAKAHDKWRDRKLLTSSWFQDHGFIRTCWYIIDMWIHVACVVVFSEHIYIYISYMGMDQYLLIPFLGEWTSIYQLFWCSPGVQGFDTLPYHYGENPNRNRRIQWSFRPPLREAFPWAPPQPCTTRLPKWTEWGRRPGKQGHSHALCHSVSQDITLW